MSWDIDNSEMLFGGVSAITRHFALFDPVQQSHLELSSPWVATGEFEITLVMYLSSLDSMIAGNSNDETSYLFVRADGGIRLRILGSTADSASSVVDLNKLHTLSVSRDISNNTSIKLNGTEVATGVQVGSFSIDLLATYRSKSLYLDGIMANVKLNDLSQTDNTFTFPINTAESDSELANETTLGSELWSDSGVFTNASGVVLGNSLTLTASAAFGSYEVYLPTEVDNGNVFAFEFNVIDPTSKTVLNIYDGSGNPDTKVQSLRFGTGRHLIISSLQKLKRYAFKHQEKDKETQISDISIREIHGNAITLFGIPESNSELFQFNDPVWDNISPPPQQLPSTIEVA